MKLKPFVAIFFALNISTMAWAEQASPGAPSSGMYPPQGSAPGNPQGNAPSIVDQGGSLHYAPSSGGSQPGQAQQGSGMQQPNQPQGGQMPPANQGGMTPQQYMQMQQQQQQLLKQQEVQQQQQQPSGQQPPSGSAPMGQGASGSPTQSAMPPAENGPQNAQPATNAPDSPGMSAAGPGK